jgi:hypothetical protein
VSIYEFSVLWTPNPGIVPVATTTPGLQSVYLTGNYSGQGMTLVANTSTDDQGVIVLYNLSGQLLQKRTVQLYKGLNSINLPVAKGQQKSITVISLFINGRAAYSQKVML